MKDLLYCYRDNSDALCYYYSMYRGQLPEYLLKIKFDLIIFHTCFISERWLGGDTFKKQVYPLVKGLERHEAVKIVMPQDEWIYTDVMNDFILDFNVSIVYSVAPESEWPTIYPKVDRSKIRMYKVLTGYISDQTLMVVDRLRKNNWKRNIDVGYRAFRAPAWLGKHGFLKTRIAEVFSAQAPMYNLKTDISTREQDTILGINWYKFLLRCKYFIGVEGGATVFDPRGDIWEKGTRFSEQNPNATYEEIERACFPGLDGSLKLIAISPRHLEAVLTRTCQVLVEGHYNGILKPDLHYIELKGDFSNLKDVLEKLRDDKLRDSIVERAYADIVLSQKYSYKTFVNFIITTSLIGKTVNRSGVKDLLVLVLNKSREWWVNFKKMKFSKWRRDIYYYIRVAPYAVLAKLGLAGFKERARKIRY